MPLLVTFDSAVTMKVLKCSDYKGDVYAVIMFVILSP